jgi:hypothetical protein
MDLGETGLGGVDWIRLSQDRDRWWAVVSAVMNLRVLAPWSECVRHTYVRNGLFKGAFLLNGVSQKNNGSHNRGSSCRDKPLE